MSARREKKKKDLNIVEAAGAGLGGGIITVIVALLCCCCCLMSRKPDPKNKKIVTYVLLGIVGIVGLVFLLPMAPVALPAAIVAVVALYFWFRKPKSGKGTGYKRTVGARKYNSRKIDDSSPSVPSFEDTVETNNAFPAKAHKPSPFTGLIGGSIWEKLKNKTYQFAVEKNVTRVENYAKQKAQTVSKFLKENVTVQTTDPRMKVGSPTFQRQIQQPIITSDQLPTYSNNQMQSSSNVVNAQVTYPKVDETNYTTLSMKLFPTNVPYIVIDIAKCVDLSKKQKEMLINVLLKEKQRQLYEKDFTLKDLDDVLLHNAFSSGYYRFYDLYCSGDTVFKQIFLRVVIFESLKRLVMSVTDLILLLDSLFFATELKDYYFKKFFKLYNANDYKRLIKNSMSLGMLYTFYKSKRFLEMFSKVHNKPFIDSFNLKLLVKNANDFVSLFKAFELETKWKKSKIFKKTSREEKLMRKVYKENKKTFLRGIVIKQLIKNVRNEKKLLK